MRYISTRSAEQVGLVDAVMRGLAADGGLYMPAELPRFGADEIEGETFAEIAAELLAPFFADSELERELPAICREALDFPLPLKTLVDGELAVLELFHGPTAAFKDVGARFLAARLRLRFTDARAFESQCYTRAVRSLPGSSISSVVGAGTCARTKSRERSTTARRSRRPRSTTARCANGTD
jgi:hypothetical protein